MLIFLAFYPAFRYFLYKPKRYKNAHKLRRLWGNILTFFGGLRAKMIDKSNVNWNDKPVFLVVANHSSYLDIISISCQVPLDLNFMAKNELAKIPLFGIFFRTIDIAVNRASSMQSGKAYLRAKNQLFQKTRSLAIFPEGGIKKTIPNMAPFKKGPFQMAIECGVPILPVVLPDNYVRGPGDKFYGTPGKMRTIILEPIDTQNWKIEQADQLKDIVFQLLNTELQSLRT